MRSGAFIVTAGELFPGPGRGGAVLLAQQTRGLRRRGRRAVRGAGEQRARAAALKRSGTNRYNAKVLNKAL
jgi:hypothetical protein